jgi:hypothetical protein
LCGLVCEYRVVVATPHQAARGCAPLERECGWQCVYTGRLWPHLPQAPQGCAIGGWCPNRPCWVVLRLSAVMHASTGSCGCGGGEMFARASRQCEMLPALRSAGCRTGVSERSRKLAVVVSCGVCLKAVVLCGVGGLRSDTGHAGLGSKGLMFQHACKRVQGDFRATRRMRV